MRKPLATSSVSAAALFRSIEKWTPTLLIDEADTFLKENHELRGVLNAGHTRELAYVLRCDGEQLEPKRFSVWGPKAIACIGKLQETLSDRSIEIRLQRKTKAEETVPPWGYVARNVRAAGPPVDELGDGQRRTNQSGSACVSGHSQ